jgi:hypothetical protein
LGNIRSGNVQLSNRHSVALTDVTVISQEPVVSVKFKGEDKMEHLRVISIQDVDGTSLLFLANNFREAELLVCGLKLLLERETKRLGVRGGQSLPSAQRNRDGTLSPTAARGFQELRSSPPRRRDRDLVNQPADESTIGGSLTEPLEKELPQGRRSWGNVPGRSYMRRQAATTTTGSRNGEDRNEPSRDIVEHGVPHYAHGQQVVKDVARNVRISFPLSVCRVHLLDATSPVMKKWETGRGDRDFETSRWAFPPATPRELEVYSSDHQLITSGSMCGANRTITFNRPRYGSLVKLSETHTVDTDDSANLVITVTERNPRRGFSVRVKVILRAAKEKNCEASVIAEIRPVGKNMSNQVAVHKAFTLVLDEINQRYGTETCGLLSVLDNMEGSTSKGRGSKSTQIHGLFHRTGPETDDKKADHQAQPSTVSSRNKPEKGGLKSGLVSFEDMLKPGGQTPQLTRASQSSSAERPVASNLTHVIPEANPSKRLLVRTQMRDENATANGNDIDDNDEPRLIQVKPLPKIRLSLMPSPREEDEYNDSETSPSPIKQGKKKGLPSRSKQTNMSSSSAPSGSRSSSRLQI